MTEKSNSTDSDELFDLPLFYDEQHNQWVKKLWEEDEQEAFPPPLLCLREWKNTSRLMITFNELNNTVKCCHRERRTLKDKIGSLCMDGTISVFSGVGVYINRALYTGQPIGDLLPMGQYGATLWCTGNTTPNPNYLRVSNKKTKKECVCHKDSDIHFSSYLTFSDDIYECNIAVLDDLTLAVLKNIFHGDVKQNKEISFVNPVKAVCYLGNWSIK